MRARFASVLLALASASTLGAQTITSSGDAALAGATVIDFQSAAPGMTFGPVVIGGVTFTPGAGQPVIIESDYAGQYNTSGQYLATQYMTTSLRFDFAAPVSAFGFNFGASDVVWTLSAYDTFGALLATTGTPVTGPSNAGEFIGLGSTGAGIAYATLDGSSTDYVMIDNFAFAAGDVRATVTPEPASIALMGTGLVGLVGFARRKRNA